MTTETIGMKAVAFVVGLMIPAVVFLCARECFGLYHSDREPGDLRLQLIVLRLEAQRLAFKLINALLKALLFAVTLGKKDAFEHHNADGKPKP